jgi:hypothetical protein
MVGRVAATGQPDPAVDDREFTRPGADLDRLPSRQPLRDRRAGRTGVKALRLIHDQSPAEE